eukprot:g3133.t1
MLDKVLVSKAVTSLLKYVSAKKKASSTTPLLDDGETMSLIISLAKVPENPKNKPIHIPIPHSLYDLDTCEICLFVKDADAKTIKAKLAENPVPGLKKVIGLEKLRKNYKQYKEKRQLLNSYELFLTDDRIMPMLPTCLGKKFFNAKKHPVPIKCTAKKNLAKQVERARNATYLYLGWGSCSAVRIALTSFEPNEIVENIMTAMETIVEKIPKKMKGIQAIHLKTNDSIALPIYNSIVIDTSVVEQDKTEKLSLKQEKKRKLIGEGKNTVSKKLKREESVTA